MSLLELTMFRTGMVNIYIN